MAEQLVIRDLRPGMKSVTCIFIVIDKGSANYTKEGKIVRKCRVADRSGSIFFSVWNEKAEAIEEGDIIRLSNGYVSQWKGSLVLYSGVRASVSKIGEFTMLYSELPDMSEPSEVPQDWPQPQAHAKPSHAPPCHPSPVGSQLQGTGGGGTAGHRHSNGAGSKAMGGPNAPLAPHNRGAHNRSRAPLPPSLQPPPAPSTAAVQGPSMYREPTHCYPHTDQHKLDKDVSPAMARGRFHPYPRPHTCPQHHTHPAWR